MLPRHLCALILSIGLVACGSKNPAGPSPTTTTTRIIVIDGGLDFGGVGLNQSATRNFTIRNTGNATLTISGMTVPAGTGSAFVSTWTNGTIAANASQDVTVRFSPTAPQSYSGTVTVNGDQTSGTNTIPVNARGTLDGVPVFTRSGSGDTVFDGMPSYVTRVQVVGVFTGRSSNFIMRVNGRLLVNELLGTSWGPTRYDGTLLLPNGPGTVEVVNSSGVAWSIAEVRP